MSELELVEFRRRGFCAENAPPKYRYDVVIARCGDCGDRYMWPVIGPAADEKTDQLAYMCAEGILAYMDDGSALGGAIAHFFRHIIEPLFATCECNRCGAPAGRERRRWS